LTSRLLKNTHLICGSQGEGPLTALGKYFFNNLLVFRGQLLPI
ncbi:MAG: hypothetical protein H6Q45_617, partial [Deltaproteobacteria bacterium]|nr:hypothetical protein [Deltaproteobacteria bacterium]